MSGTVGISRRALLAAPAVVLTTRARALPLRPEKDVLRVGVAKTLDMAPLAVAADERFFEEVDLQVVLEPQASWKTAFDRLLTGDLDAAQLLPAQALAAAAGVGPKATLLVPFVFGPARARLVLPEATAATFSGETPAATPLRAAIDDAAAEGRRLSLGVASRLATEAFALRHWLALSRIHPGFHGAASSADDVDAEVAISVLPSPQMPTTLVEGALAGFAAAEPWPEIARAKGIGRPVLATSAIVGRIPGSVLAIGASWAAKHPQTLTALLLGLMRAARWLDAGDGRNHPAATRWLAASDRLGADERVIAAAFAATRGAGGFFEGFASEPFRDDAIWLLAEMRRWGMIEEARDDAWYGATAAAVLRPDLHHAAARRLVTEGRAETGEFDGTGRRSTPLTLLGRPGGFDPDLPLAHLAAEAIGRRGPTGR